MTGLEQAPEPYPLTKICLISKGVHDPRIRYQADKNRYYNLVLAAMFLKKSLKIFEKIFENILKKYSKFF